jgi:L-amino acid N-acyltransferase YncA
MKDNITIDLASEMDYERMAEIYNESIQKGAATMEESHYTAAKISAWVEKFEERERLYALKDAGKTIGWGIIKFYSPREGYRFACETAIYITETELRNGYGSLMKNFLIEKCKELDYHHLVAKIFASNTASIEYNLKIGYSIVGRQKEIGFRNGKWVDIVIMQYLIS